MNDCDDNLVELDYRDGTMDNEISLDETMDQP